MTEGALVLRGVVKRYGARAALDGLEVDVPRGSLTALVGPNGAGKTTAFGVAGGFVRADAGTIDVLGRGPFAARTHAGRVTLLPQDAELPAHSIVRDVLVYHARLQGQSARASAWDADRVLDLVSLRDRARSKIRELSHGMRRRVALAQCFLGDPELVMLDEPTSGLDPHLVVQVRELLAAQRGKRTLVVSSHVLSELESICDHVVMLEHGRAVRAGTMESVTGRGEVVRVRVEDAPSLEVLRDALGDDEARLEQDEVVVRARPGEDVAAVNARVLPALLARGVRVVEVRRGHGLEQAYMEARAAATRDAGAG